MRISNIKLDHFRRFTDLEISDLPEKSRLVVLAGPNGCGKSSLFDALFVWYQIYSGLGWEDQKGYYYKSTDLITQIDQRVRVDIYGRTEPPPRGSFYFRSAYRNDPEFNLNTLNRVGSIVDDLRFRRMIQGDATVTSNYHRLISQAFEDVFAKEDESTTIGQYREKVIGDIRASIKRIFPDLILNSLGNPLDHGTFRFDKGSTSGFEYMNLSGGEKAAFDIILDLVVRRSAYADAVYCIDEPESHMNTRLQGALLDEIYKLVPDTSQLWIATHSIGTMRRARELADETPGAVTFLDFEGHDFDKKVVIKPSKPSRTFWERVLAVALDDLASLVAPREVVICEGNPAGAVPGKNVGHDATVYNTIFGDELPDVKFVSSGNSREVAADRLGLVAALPMIAPGVMVRRLVDRDDHAPADVARMAGDRITTLGRRHLESYLYDDEVLIALCASVAKSGEATAMLAEKQQAIVASISRRNPQDDIKSAAGDIYVKAKQRLGLTAIGNDQMAFARATLAPLIKPGMAIYAELKRDIFGPHTP